MYLDKFLIQFLIQIRSFPSKEFYEEALEDGPDVEDQTRRSWHNFRCFGPFCFFDLQEGKESQASGSGSHVNVDEVEFVLAMYSKLISSYPELKASSRIAIISPYRHQVKLFREKFRSTFGVQSDKLVDINTVDGFQVVLSNCLIICMFLENIILAWGYSLLQYLCCSNHMLELFFHSFNVLIIGSV